MPCGVWTITGIPDDKIGKAMAVAKAGKPIKVEKTQAADGTWTIVKTYPPCKPGTPQEKSKAFVS